MASANSHQLTRKGKSMAILYVGIDLAKNVLAIHGVDEHGKAMLMRSRCNAPGCISWWPRCLRAHRDGSLLGSAPLGEAFCTARPHRAPDGSEVRLALSDERQAGQERCGRRAGDLRSSAEAEHALRSGQEPGRAGAAVHPPRAPGVRRAAHRHDQPPARPLERVRDRPG